MTNGCASTTIAATFVAIHLTLTNASPLHLERSTRGVDGSRDGGVNVTETDGDCPCGAAALCERVSIRHDVEVFGFGDKAWQTYDWNSVTTLAWPSDWPNVMCKAHAHNARVIMVRRASHPMQAYG